MKHWATLIIAAVLVACQIAPHLSPTTQLKDYEKEVYRRMQATWTALATERNDSLKVGSVRIACKILPDGRISDFKVLSNSGGEILATVARLTVERTVIPPIPSAALSELPHGYDPSTFTFTVNQQR